MKYFFRDKNPEHNGEDGLYFAAAGIAEPFVEIGKEVFSGKEAVVTYIHPFQGVVVKEWRAYKDIELYEVEEFSNNGANYNMLKDAIDAVNERVSRKE